MTQGPCHYILHNLEYKCRKRQVDVYVLHITMEILLLKSEKDTKNAKSKITEIELKM